MEFATGRWRRLVPWFLLLVFSLALHLWLLEERSYHHDEAIHAHAAYNLAKNGNYRYDPTYHGPLLYYLTAGTFVVAGDTDFTARLPIALAGVLLIVIAWNLRRPLGGRAAWWTALLVTVSPTFLFYGRFLRMDILEVLVASAAVIAAWRAAHGSSTAWIWVGVWTGLAFATKENAFVTSALLGGVTLLMVAGAGLRQSLPAILGWAHRHRWGLISAAAAMLIVAVPIFTVGFRYPGDWFFPYKAISYWWNQHNIQRVAGPPWYHLPRLGLYEFLPIIAGIAWALRRRRRMRQLEWALLLFALSSVAMYCYLGEKVPWLGVHQVWAFLPLAGMQLARTFGPRGRWWSRALAVTGIAATLVVSVRANFVLDEISPNRSRVEALIYVQTCPELLPPMAEGYRLQAEGADPVAAVGGEAGWPISWYWRKTPTWWSNPGPAMRPPLVFCDPDEEGEVRRRLGPGYVSERLPLRAWWLMEGQRPSFSEIVRYAITRVPWGSIGSSDVILLRHTGEPAAGAREEPVPQALAPTLNPLRAEVFGEGWLVEPHGMAVAPDGVLAVADVGLSDVVFFAADGRPLETKVPDSLKEPEAVAWTPNGVLVIADTWNHRVVLFNPSSGGVRALPEPEEGWFGPRAVAVAEDGTLAVADTGHKRIVLVTFPDGEPQLQVVGSAGSAAGELVEPVGLTWLDDQRLLVCDTGNRRLQIFDRRGLATAEIALPDAWSDFYSRPQVVALDVDRWLVTDTPGGCLWLVEGDRIRRIGLEEADIVPTGLTKAGDRLYLADAKSRLWALTLAMDQ
jgi:uncharacterized protein (TIGR03663 family)